MAEYERLTEKIRPGATMAAVLRNREAARSQAYQRIILSVWLLRSGAASR